MKLSYVIVTRNRRDPLLQTLARLQENTHLSRRSWETIVVDNASDDGSPEAVAKKFRGVRLVRLPENEGMPGRNHGFKIARGRYVCLLDDDSYPTGQAVPMSLAYLDRQPKTAAVVGRVELPSGACEAPALPCVLLGGASVVRKSVLDDVGGFSPEFFRQAEEYDLSFRILRRGHRIERFEDVVFRHEKVPGGRSSALVHRMDLRNNLILVERFLPKPLRRQYRHDWVRRYTALARQDGQQAAAKKGLYEALVWARRERAVGRQTLDEQTVETIFSLRARAEAVVAWKKLHGIRRVAIADFSKNLYATYAACGLASLEPLALLDDREAFKGMTYRGLPVRNYSELANVSCDGVIVSNTNPAQVVTLTERVRASTKVPVLSFWEPRYMNEPVEPKTTGKPSAPSARAA
jgi:GT2 family glycosyltransferase